MSWGCLNDRLLPWQRMWKMSQVPLLAAKKLLSSPSLSPSFLTFVKSVRLWVRSRDWIGGQTAGQGPPWISKLKAALNKLFSCGLLVSVSKDEDLPLPPALVPCCVSCLFTAALGLCCCAQPFL